ncbi:MAG TPA: DUF1722 domain-containing protein [Bacillales bacterium]|nr:DUF1722 domain-containing protein [Bacillales bacterium]
MNEVQRIARQKNVLKAAEAVWAANKYFVLGCSQKHYLQIRSHFRPDQRDLSSAYRLLEQTEDDFRSVVVSDLPELPNALQHVMGYFKKLWTQEDKQALNIMIKEHPEKALRYLEEQSFLHHVDYLLPCRLWPKNRAKPFNGVPISITENGQSYPPYTWLWKGDHLVLNE